MTICNDIHNDDGVVYTGNPAYPATWGLWEWLGASQLQAKGKLHPKILEPKEVRSQAGT
jgi:hypothetical protein